jgi:peptidyl-prolyl cis-trans isomerase D
MQTERNGMLSLMREKAGSWIIKIVLGAIVIVFVFWGVGSFRESQKNRVALVNGEPILIDAYKRAYQNYMQNIEQQYGKNLNQDMLKLLQVSRRVMDTLVSQKLMVQEAQKLDLRVTDQELAASIQNMAAFQEAGIFDNRRYQFTLEQNKLEPEIFEAAQRESILLSKVHTLITNNIKVTDGEIKEWYEWQKASVNIDYVVFSPEGYKDIVPTEDELKVFYEENKEAYKTEPMVKVRYLEFDTEKFKASVEIDDDDISIYYEDHFSEYQKEKTVSARHILLKVDQNASEEVVAEKQKKAEEIMNLAREGKDFGELAKQYSEGPTKDKGGDLGEFKKGTMVAPFADKAFSMSSGDISEPVRTRFGWHIIKVEKVNEATTEPLASVSDKIRDELSTDQAKEVAYDTAESIFDELADEDDFEKVAGDNQIASRTTDFFTRKGPSTGIGEASKFAEIAFDLEDMEISDVRNFGERYYIIQKIESKPAAISELATVKDKVTQDCIRKMQDERAKEDADALLKAINDGSELKEAAEKYNREIANTGFFTREGAIPTVGREPEISQAAFALSAKTAVADSVFKGVSGYYVIKLNERKAADADGLADQKESIKNGVLSQKQNKLIQNWLAGIKETSEILIEEGYLSE